MTARLFQTCADITLAEPHIVLQAFHAHLLEHDLHPQDDNGWQVVVIHDGQFRSRAEAGHIRLQAEAKTLETLQDIRQIISSHLIEIASTPLVICWQGDGLDLVRPPAFRELRVAAARQLTPHMRRITLLGDDLDRYASEANLHCKLLLPPPGTLQPQWPTLGSDGLVRMPTGEHKLDVRTYTIRHIDAAAGWLEIDFVVHADAGPGSRWAQSARPGDRIGMSGPGGQGVREADWYLLAGDETALPAIARILEHLPDHAQGVALIEVQDRTDQVPLQMPPGMSLRWLPRSESPNGANALLEAIRATVWPKPGTRLFAWSGTEFSTYTAIRRHWREDHALGRYEHLAVAYWRRGQAEDLHRGKGR